MGTKIKTKKGQNETRRAITSPYLFTLSNVTVNRTISKEKSLTHHNKGCAHSPSQGNRAQPLKCIRKLN